MVPDVPSGDGKEADGEECQAEEAQEDVFPAASGPGRRRR